MLAYGNASTQKRSAVPIQNWRHRRAKCWLCGKGKRTHVGVVEAVQYEGGRERPVQMAMTTGCFWCVRQWVRNPNWRPAR